MGRCLLLSPCSWLQNVSQEVGYGMQRRDVFMNCSKVLIHTGPSMSWFGLLVLGSSALAEVWLCLLPRAVLLFFAFRNK